METLMDEICGYINNYFTKRPDGIHRGFFSIQNGALNVDFLQNGQYFRVKGSVFNDGVHVYPSNNLINEEFDGEIWAMSVPPAVIALMHDIDDWNAKYTETIQSPFTSESFGGYSYQKASGSGATGADGDDSGWKSAFGGKLNRWRKL